MSRRLLAFAGSINLILVLFCTGCCEARGKKHHCHPSSCGGIQVIQYPFRLKGENCGESYYELSCENNQTVLELNSKRYHVKAIGYENSSIRIVDPVLDNDNCSSFPTQSLLDEDIDFRGGLFIPYYENIPVAFIRCAVPAHSSHYVDTVSCSENSIYLTNSPGNYSYVAIGDGMRVYEGLENNCGLEALALVSLHAPIADNTSFWDIRGGLAYGFELSWNRTFGLSQFMIPSYVEMCIVLIIFAKCVCCGPCVFAFLVYKLRRRHLSAYDAIEDFLQNSNNNLMPVRYSYSQIRKMTRGFRDKLGEGGYGTVFKGKLRSGPLVAVKMLGKSKATGQEFLNEVTTIGRIHHVNVVHLIGFCSQGSKRALVYDYMPNGSLDKYIFPREEGTISLSWEKLYEISLGVARGIEYLHRGCDMQILHFDIKPHNILLDENFVPKISDFGLAKLYPTDDSIVTLTGIRGTMGYMAPELFYKNIGGVSYKADVYSFGMLMMELAGRRKNLDAFVDHSSQIYFPTWVYDQLNHGKDIDMGDASESETRLVKKMIMVALWCIQMKPIDRPSMSKVVEMLEEDTTELIQMPPKPFLAPQEVPTEDPAGLNTNTDISSNASIISLEIQAN